MAKKWRRSGGGRPIVVGLGPPVLSPEGAELVLVEGVTPYVGSYYLEVEMSDDGVAGWAHQSTWPIDADPYHLDQTGNTGKFIRAAIADGGGNPLGPWSNVLEVP